MKIGSWDPIEHRPPLKPIEIVKRYMMPEPKHKTCGELLAESYHKREADRIWKLVVSLHRTTQKNSPVTLLTRYRGILTMGQALKVRRRKKQPYNPALRNSGTTSVSTSDRRAVDLLRNAQVTPVEVDDPYEAGATILVMRSTRDDPLAEMRARNQIDDCDYEAGRHWQRAWEAAEIGGVCGIDPTKEAVDGGRMREVVTDRQIRAAKELATARAWLGPVNNWIIVSVLGTRKNLRQLAIESAGARGPVEDEYKYLRRRFKRGLSTLAELFGYQSAK